LTFPKQRFFNIMQFSFYLACSSMFFLLIFCLCFPAYFWLKRLYPSVPTSFIDI